MSAEIDRRERARLEDLTATLRDATYAALANHSSLARSLDESRCELERLLMLSTVDATECRRAGVRAQMVLCAWQTMATGAFARSH